MNSDPSLAALLAEIERRNMVCLNTPTPCNERGPGYLRCAYCLLAAAACALREQQEAVAALVSKWRDAAVCEHDDMSNAKAWQTFDQCADELEAALASSPAEQQRTS